MRFGGPFEVSPKRGRSRSFRPDILFGQTGFILLRGCRRGESPQRLAVIPGHPFRRDSLQLSGMAATRCFVDEERLFSAHARPGCCRCRRPRHSQEESEFFRVSQQIGDRLAQTGVRFDFPFLELGIRPRTQLFHHRSAVLLVELEALIRRQAVLPRLLVVAEDLAQLGGTRLRILPSVEAYLWRAKGSASLTIDV